MWLLAMMLRRVARAPPLLRPHSTTTTTTTTPTREASELRRVVNRLVDYFEEDMDEAAHQQSEGGQQQQETSQNQEGWAKTTLPGRVAPAQFSPEAIERGFAARGVSLRPDGHKGDVMAAVDAVLAHSVRTRHPLFLNQLYGGADATSVAAELLLTVLNTNAHTYEVAPALTLVERAVVDRVGNMLYRNADSDSDSVDSDEDNVEVEGLTTPGGSLSNLYGMSLARHHFYASRGAGTTTRQKPTAFVSEDAHYSYLKAARVLGINEENLVKVPVDEKTGKMRADALKEALRAARGEPFFVGSTAGTTVRGAFDDLDDISDACRSFHKDGRHIWHHVDAAWGGAMLWSAFAERRRLLAGARRADSVALNAHKLLNVALPCALFLTRHSGALERAHASRASYLFQKDKSHNDLDLGDRTIQCGRKADALKLWLSWKHHGDEGLARRVDNCLDLAQVAADHVRHHPHLHLVYEPAFANVCFRVVPPSLLLSSSCTGVDHPPSTGSGSERAAHSLDRTLHRLAPLVKRKMRAAGDALIGFQATRDQPVNFFRLVVTQGDGLDSDHLVAMLDRMADVAESLVGEAAASSADEL